jgi:hypothetical protein
MKSLTIEVGEASRPESKAIHRRQDRPAASGVSRS